MALVACLSTCVAAMLIIIGSGGGGCCIGSVGGGVGFLILLCSGLDWCHVAARCGHRADCVDNWR